MCARYFFTRSADDPILEAINIAMERNYPGQYKTGEIFPGDTAPAVVERQGRIVAVPAGFGFPGFEKNKLIINARSETAAEKKTFADSLRSRRVVLPASGFYEWSHHESKKTKYLFTVNTMPTLYLCGIYKLIDGAYRFVILTRPANESMIETHDRMPVIVGGSQVRTYLTDWNVAGEIIAGDEPVLSRERA